MHMVIYFLDLLAIISSKNRVITVYLHMKLQSPSSVVIIQQKEMAFTVAFIII